MRTPHTFTRTELTAALAALDRPDVAAGLYARRLDPPTAARVGARTALAMDYDEHEAGAVQLLALAVARLLGEEAAIDFAVATRPGTPVHPGGCGQYAAYWPGWVLDEPTLGEWTDTIVHCGACAALGDDGPCDAHATAPWDLPAPAPVR